MTPRSTTISPTPDRADQPFSWMPVETCSPSSGRSPAVAGSAASWKAGREVYIVGLTDEKQHCRHLHGDVFSVELRRGRR